MINIKGMIRSISFLGMFFLMSICYSLAQGPKLLIRIDDIGMNHSVNMALKDAANTKMKLSASVMFACPWYQEAVEILKENPQISVGVHLTLNSEWKNYRWGPVLGKEAVPTLVAEDGYFYPSTQEFLDADYDLDEVERELEAQIQRAISTGLKVDYIDFHMRTALATPELTEITKKLADKYNMKRSMLMGEGYKSLFGTEISQKETDLLTHLEQGLDKGKVNLVIMHMAKANPEMKALVDMNNADQRGEEGKPVVAMHREAELQALLSVELMGMIKNKNIQLVNYGDF